MPDQLSDLLHSSVDDVPVPHPAAYDILGRGRGLRRRRRVATGLVASVAVVAAGVGGALVLDVVGTTDSRGNQDVAGQDASTDAVTAYRQSGAWVSGDQLTIGRTTVTLPRPATYLAQTSAGVVAQLRNGAADSTFVLVRPDGTQKTLGIPATTLTINGDLAAPRVAWANDGVDQYELHVWDVAADEEVGAGTVPAPGVTPADGEQFFTPAFLDGDSAYVATARVNWATGAVNTIEHGPFSVRNDVIARQAKDGWAFDDATSNQQFSVLGRDFRNPLLSPDGRFAAVVRSTETEDWIGFTRVSDGRFTELPAMAAAPVWTPGGRMLSFSEDGSAVLLCTTAGDCETRPLPADQVADGVLLADYLNVG